MADVLNFIERSNCRKDIELFEEWEYHDVAKIFTGDEWRNSRAIIKIDEISGEEFLLMSTEQLQKKFKVDPSSSNGRLVNGLVCYIRSSVREGKKKHTHTHTHTHGSEHKHLGTAHTHTHTHTHTHKYSVS
eukprot:GHVR01121878.1.p1 GENE.GHVR01121878.1~~GHVR01121878.1.p1  ORF type:complete len:131 (-),score=78.45 GHVR01121878.1:71-463(-)